MTKKITLIFILITFYTHYFSQSSGYCALSPTNYPNSVEVDNVYSPDVINEEYDRVAFRLTAFSKTSNTDCDEWGDEDYRVNLEVLDHNFNSLNEDGLDWAKNGNCYGHDVNSSSPFTVYPGSDYFFYNRTGASITGHMFYWISMAAGENDIPPIDDCLLDSDDDCLDDWEIDSRKSIPIANYYQGYELHWGLIDRSMFSANIYWGYFITPNVGTSSNPLNFGTIDQNECPSKYHNMSNLSTNGDRPEIYYKFTINNHRRLIIDLGYQKGDMTFSLHTVSSGGSISSSAISPYSQSSSLPAAYSTTATYNKKYDLNPGTSPNTYAIKITTPTTGKFKLKIDSDLNPPNNIYYWTGVAEDPFGTTITPPENAWNRSNNWDPCIVPNNGITDPNDYTIDVVIPASSEINPNADQPRIYLDYEGKCKSIVINDGAKVTIENSGKLIIKE